MVDKKNDAQNGESGSIMADHLKKYRDYISDLKSGQSSGISSIFGRAADLLPPEVMAIKPPTQTQVQQSGQRLRVKIEKNVEGNIGGLAGAAETLLATGALDFVPQDAGTGVDSFSGDPVGISVDRPDSSRVEQVLSVYFEDGDRKFMLSDLSVIDETDFERYRVREGIQTGQDAPSSTNILDAIFASTADETSTPAETLRVTTESGALLWQVFYDTTGPKLISMADGGIIKKAEWRDDFIFSWMSPVDGDIKFYLLSALVVDPTTGNIYLEANEGAYSAAFLNTGHRIHQYRSAFGEESFFATEPSAQDWMPRTVQVRDLTLDMQSGAVSYVGIDDGGVTRLTSRSLSS